MKASDLQVGAEQFKLPLANYRFSFTACDGLVLSAQSGSALRGLFGHALRDTLCITREAECSRCLLRHCCGYSYLFETPPPPSAEKMRKYRAAPHPFLIQLPGQAGTVCSAGDVFSLEIRLFGRANDYLPHVIETWKKAGAIGLGSRPGRFTLRDVAQETVPGSANWVTIYRARGLLQSHPPVCLDIPPLPGTPSLVVDLQSPLRVVRDSRPVPPEAFSFGDLFRPLLRRVSMLSYFHGQQPLEVDFKRLNRQAEDVDLLGARLHWQRQSRYSSRQKARINIGGLRGEFRLYPRQLGPLWSYLWLGQWLGVGKGTVMGLGRYRVLSEGDAAGQSEGAAPASTNNN